MIDDFLTFLVQEQGYEDLDEFLDSRPYVNKPEKHMLLVLKCSQCSYESSDGYTRQNPDTLRLGQWCSDCHTELVLVDVVPNTIFYWCHSYKHASFSDQVEGECWQCGRKQGPLHPYTLSNGKRVELCRKDFIRYHKSVWRMNEKRAVSFSSELPNGDDTPDPARLQSFAVPVDDDFALFDFDEELYPLP